MRFLIFLLFWPMASHAEGAFALTGPLRNQIVERPQRFEAFVAGLILGYGTAQGLSAQGLEDFLAVERAKIRVREIRRLLLADLDDDGRVTQAELFVVLSAQGAGARGTLWQAHRAADGDGDGSVSSNELQAQARRVAARSEAGEADIRALMQLDGDGDGYLSTLELREAITRIAPET